MRKLLFSIFLLVVIACVGMWWSLSPHQPPQSQKSSQVASRPDVRTERLGSVAAPEVASIKGPPSAAAWSEIERTIIVGRSVDAAAQRRVLLADAKQFHWVMDSLEAAMMADPMARESADNYRELLLDRLRLPEGQQDLNLDRIVCSDKLCYAQFSGNETTWNDFSDSFSIASVEDFPTNARSLYTHTDAATGNVDFRVMFTTTPQINSFITQPPRGARR